MKVRTLKTRVKFLKLKAYRDLVPSDFSIVLFCLLLLLSGQPDHAGLLFPTMALSSHQQIVLMLVDRKSNGLEKWTYGYRYVFDE